MIRAPRLTTAPTALVIGLLEALSPECCAVCGRRRGRAPWATGIGGRAPGLRGWHVPHCCRDCLARWRRAPLRGKDGSLPLWAAQRESAELVAAIGAWKYRRLCGLGRPLAELLVPVLQAAATADGPARLVPVPLHGRRRRERGFDQTLQLAVLAGGAAAMPVAADILVRRRATRQQASEDAGGEGRRRNVAGAFTARSPRPGEDLPLALVDDLATTGATLGAAAAALRRAGWRVVWGASLGLAARLVLDTTTAPSLASAPEVPAAAAPAASGDTRQEQE